MPHYDGPCPAPARQTSAPHSIEGKACSRRRRNSTPMPHPSTHAAHRCTVANARNNELFRSQQVSDMRTKLRLQESPQCPQITGRVDAVALNKSQGRACSMRGELMACSWLRSSCPNRCALAAKSSSTCGKTRCQSLARQCWLAAGCAGSRPGRCALAAQSLCICD